MRAPTSAGTRWLRAAALLGSLWAGAPAGASAQVAVLEGRVYDAGSGAGLQNAVVTLEGRGSVLTSESGSFRYTGVPLGTYTLRVQAFGYRERTLPLEVRGDTTVSVPVDVVPIELDPVEVELRTIDFDGEARDPMTDGIVMDALVASDQGHEERTNAHGHFDLDDVLEGAPLRLEIRAFSYLPLDTTFVPDDDGRRVFELEADSLMLRMIDVQVRRLEARAEGRIATFPRSMNRDRLARYLNNFTVLDMLEREYPLRMLRRVACVLIDDRQIDDGFGAIRGELRRSYLLTTYPDEVERLEFLEFETPGGRALQLRVYTKDYMARLIGSDRRLPPPVLLYSPSGVSCR